MKNQNRTGLIVAFSVTLVASLWSLAATMAAEDKKSKPETREIVVKDIKINVPESWKQEKPSSKLRLATFKIPAAKGDSEDAELAIYSFGGGGGGVSQNIARWVGEFEADGRELKLTTGKSKQGEYLVADVSGTHLGLSFRRRSQPLANARMLSIILSVEKKGNYFLKLTGPKKTVAAAADSFRASFGGNAKEEKEYKPAL